MDPLFDSPPAIVSPAPSPTLEQIIFEACAAIDLADGQAKKGADSYAEAGRLLLLAKAEVPHGQWGDWLRKNIKRSTSQARRWMALSKTRMMRVLDEQWKLVSGVYDKELTEDGDTIKSYDHIQCRPCRTGSPKEGCRDCKALRAEAKAKDELPAEAPGSHVAESETEAGASADAASDAAELLAFKATASKIQKAVLRASKATTDQAQRLANSRDMSPQDAAQLRSTVAAANKRLENAANAPPRPVGKAKCRKCGQDTLWVTTANDKRMMLDADQVIGGKFLIINNLATMVQWDGTTDQRGFKAHFMTCSKRNRGQNP